MPLKKGFTNNPNGRPKGSKNKATVELRELIAAFLDKNFNRVERLMKQLEPRDQVKFYIDLLQFGVPKLKEVSADIEVSPIIWPEIKMYPAPGYEPINEETSPN